MKFPVNFPFRRSKDGNPHQQAIQNDEMKKSDESKCSSEQEADQNAAPLDNTDILEVYGRETLPVIIQAVIRHIKDKLPASGEFRPFILSFSPPNRKNYEDFRLWFEPDLIDTTHQNIRMFGAVPLKWNSDYEIKYQLVKGKKEEVISYLESSACRRDIMNAIVALDESERHEGP